MIARFWSPDISAFIIVLLFLTKAVAADETQVFVDAVNETGQGFLLSRARDCLLVVPAHVAAIGYALLYASAPDRLKAEAETIAELPGDVTVMLVENGPLARRCGSPLLGFGPFDARLAASRDATLVSLHKDGTWSRRPVVIRQVGFAFLTIEPRDEPLQQGLSGSLVVLGDDAVGMLQTVGADGTGTAIRLERVAALLRDYFESAKLPAPQSGPDSPLIAGRLPSSMQGATIASWKNAEAIGPEHRIGNLLDGDDRTAWVADVGNVPIDITLEFPGGAPVMLTRIRLVSDLKGRANSSPPEEVEIYRALIPGRWYSLAHGVLQQKDLLCSLELVFPPSKRAFCG